ncbi:MAG TPA: 50S ribosomal protein L25 [Clostridiales bacterium]|jgi:large subunit ribosomal protein L25|nr:50S ribosomal protein L25 [Clostridiales bacterium]
MNSDLLQVSIRAPQSKAKQLRRQGYVPGVLYGRNTTTTPVLFNKNHVENFIKRVGEGTVFDIELDGIKQTVRIREMQRDPISKEIIHLDLMNVDLDQEIKINVALRFEGMESLEKSGYIVQQQKDSIEVEGLARNIPSFVSVPMDDLAEKGNIRVQDLEVPDGISVLDAPDDVIVSALTPAKETETDEDAAEEEIDATDNDQVDQ